MSRWLNKSIWDLIKSKLGAEGSLNAKYDSDLDGIVEMADDADTVDGMQGDYIRDWNNLLNKPSTFPPDAHSHTKSEITDFAHTHVKSEITDFSHTHPGSDITSQVPEADMLDGKHLSDILDLIPQRDNSGAIVYESSPSLINDTTSQNSTTSTTWVDLYSKTFTKLDKHTWIKIYWEQAQGSTASPGGKTRVKVTDGVTTLYTAEFTLSTTTWTGRTDYLRIKSLQNGTITVTVQGLYQYSETFARYLKVYRNLTEAD
jgi:hypothetical protein